jgi:predicted dinucleotide-binding enzyme
MSEKARVAMIGRGNVGQALAQGLAHAGYRVETAGKEPDKIRSAARDATIVFLAVPYGERENALRELGDTVSGKIVVDVTNAITPTMDFAGTTTRSGAEEVQQRAKGAKVVKAFNTAFAQHMSTGRLGREPVTLFVAGDDDPAKGRVLSLGSELGFDPVDAGPLATARWLEAMGYFDIALGYKQRFGTDAEFRLVRGEPSS